MAYLVGSGTDHEASSSTSIALVLYNYMILYRLPEPILIATCVYNSICNLAMVLVLQFVETQAFRQCPNTP